VALVGGNGAGKSTLMKSIVGLVPMSQGLVLWQDRPIVKSTREVAYLSQRAEVNWEFPVTVRSLIELGRYPLLGPWQRFGEVDREAVDRAMATMRIDDLARRQVGALSGGQQQRVALARSLALEPKVLLLDEPLSNLDANLRVVMRDEIRNIQERIGITTIFVTHDQYEAMSISDRLLVLNDGVIQQIGTPSDIYETPDNRFNCGKFVGYVNFLEGKN